MYLSLFLCKLRIYQASCIFASCINYLELVGAPAWPMSLCEVMSPWKCRNYIRSCTHELFEVLGNTTWESLQKARAYCCVPIGLVSTLMCNYIYGFWDQRKAWPLNVVLFGWGIIIRRFFSVASWTCSYRRRLNPHALTGCEKASENDKVSTCPNKCRYTFLYFYVNVEFIKQVVYLQVV